MKKNATNLLKRGIALLIVFSVIVSGLMLDPVPSKAGGIFDGATIIELGTEVQGTIAKDATTSLVNSGVYKITLPSTGKLNIALTSYLDSMTSFSVYSSDKTLIKNESNMKWDATIKQLSKKYEFYLTKGDYYIVISGHSTDSDSLGTYMFSTLFTSSKVTNAGTNNEFSTATELKLFKTCTGQISINDAIDYYKFTVKEDGYYQLNQFNQIGDSVYALYDEEGSILDYQYVKWNKLTKKGQTKSSNKLKAGTYIIEIKPYDYYDNNETYSATCVYNFSVTPCISKIKLNKTTVTLKKGKSFNAKATITPTFSKSVPVTWTSSKPAVATVSSSGKIKTKGKGTTYIICKSSDAKGKSAKIKVVVK